ncbi:protein translocase subunit SecD [Rugosimonospora africana]|uniref:Protein translocase subunit SecD n=1 Tax=Rugosimonospora africana TaxID=556532 RepID=A0A8J3QVX4_9ACTN|nr:protein translocase subunit SecD [Rugosimonospora africana]GIH15741.1 protein translocase subunit SecD [Rugosimonospora africana]
MAPSRGRPHPGRPLAVLGLVFLVLASLVFFAGVKGDSSLRQRLAPKLGLDLIGGTQVTLSASTPDGKAPDAGRLEEARRIISSRVNGLGVSEAQVVTQGDRDVVVSVPGQSNDDIKQIGVPAQLRFREVLDQTPGVAPPAGGTTPAGTSTTGTVPLSTVEKKLGAAYPAAQALTGPADASGDPASVAALQPFASLSPAEVAVLPPEVAFNVPYITCDQLDKRAAGSIQQAGTQAVACDQSTKYLLDSAKVLGTDVANAQAATDPQTGAWVVNLSFTGSGQDKWTSLSEQAYDNGAQQQVAVVLDNQVVSAPAIQGVITGDAQITGGFSQSQANLLADQLKFGALPLTFQQSQAQSISASIGRNQLRAGLLAAGLGMLLVVLYSFFYYRLLGTVIVLSLGLSAALVYGFLVVLGRQIGFTLTLAGIAGFIVSLGVAADSFVIYFERLKDEIREGRGPRSAVPRAWARARRTIVSANVITILAAIVLYLVSVGTVKGFAFALGMATTLDLVVVFLFRHPVMTLFANTKAFLSPKVSGLGRIAERRAPARTEAGRLGAGRGASRAKEV